MTEEVKSSTVDFLNISDGEKVTKNESIGPAKMPDALLSSSNISTSTSESEIMSYLAEMIEDLFQYFTLSNQNELPFPWMLLSHERSYIHRRAKELNLFSVTKCESSVPFRSIVVYKKKPVGELTTKYPITLSPTIILKVTTTLDKYPVTTTEFRVFVNPKDYDDLAGQDTDVKFSREFTELDFGLSAPTSQSGRYFVPDPTINSYRNSLRIYEYKSMILYLLNYNKVLIIHGGIASGKSTQVPQMLMEKCYEESLGYKIFLCEPYRITTVAVAERIATERREEIGQSVGYQIPLETKKSATSMVICITPDVLLKMMISKELVFRGKVIVILDEFEENDYMIIFLMIALKDLLKTNTYLRVVIMTNQTDVMSLQKYFEQQISTAVIPVISSPLPVKEFYLEDILKFTDYLNKCRTKIPEFKNGSFNRYLTNGVEDINTMQVVDKAMDKAWETGCTDAFTFLLNVIKKHVISVNYQVKSNGTTLLMSVCRAGNIEYVNELLRSGADISIRCYKGKNAFDWALDKHHQDVVDFINQFLANNVDRVMLERDPSKWPPSTFFDDQGDRLVTYYYSTRPESEIDLDLLFTVVLHIHAKFSTGAIMIFLPNFADILSFRDILFQRESVLTSSGGNFILRFLYSNMQTSEQKMIFQIAPIGYRKIILSTNVGAVGITISDLLYVIDTGHIEQKVYLEPTGKSTFITSMVTASQALQRSSKAGRSGCGSCFKLYSKRQPLVHNNTSSSFNWYTCSPQMLCLYTKQMVPEHMPVLHYLKQALIIPDRETLTYSVDILKNIDAFDHCKNVEYLTELGKIMLQLPLEPQYAKMVLYSVALKCLDPILTIAAFSKHKTIFNLEEKHKSKSHTAAKEWKKISSKYFSDHLILIKLFLGRQSAGVEKQDKEYCDELCISQSTLELVNTTRSNIVGHLRAMGIVKTRGVNDMRDLNTNSREWVFVKAALVGGLYPNLIFVDRNVNENKPKLLCNKTQKEVFIDPLSTILDYTLLPSNQGTMNTQKDVLGNLPTDWLVCNDLNNSSMASVCTSVTPLSLAIFAGSYKLTAAISNQRVVYLLHNSNIGISEDSDSNDEENISNESHFMINRHLQFRMSEETARAVLYLRIKWFSYFLKCIKSPSKAMANDEKQFLETLTMTLKNDEIRNFSNGDPDFIGMKPASYTIDLSQQPNHISTIVDSTPAVHNPIIGPPRLMTENSRYFLIRNFIHDYTSFMISGIWRFDPMTEQKMIEVFNTGADVKLFFQSVDGKYFLGVGKLMSIQYCNQTNVLPVKWLKDGKIPVTSVEEYLDRKIEQLPDGTEIEFSLASTLMMLWNNKQFFQIRPNTSSD